MADIFLSLIITQLHDVVVRQVSQGVKLVAGVDEEVENLSEKLETIEKVLQDAERRRLKESSVCKWLEKLDDITYGMVDVLDEWNLKILRPNQLGAQEKATRDTRLLKKVCSVFPSRCYCLKELSIRSDIALKIQDINRKLELNLKEANDFNFVINHSGRNVDSNEFKRPMTTSIVDLSKVYGRELDKTSLLEQLLPRDVDQENGVKIVSIDQENGVKIVSTDQENGVKIVSIDQENGVKIVSTDQENGVKIVSTDQENGVKIVSIVGAGGSGKTTLAQFLYNNERVKAKFQLQKWVCMSDPFDEIRVARALVESPEKDDTRNVLELESLLQLVKDRYSGKRFLLVLDDVWTKDHSKWQPFGDSLKDGAPGSIIMVTTREENVARVVGTDHIYHLGLLSDSDCWSIIKYMALSKRFDQLFERVEKIGEKIANKCKGLPLAAKILGGLLQFKDTPEEWQEVLESEIWKMEEAVSGLFPHFCLSYKELSTQQKICFSYCAVFPKDTVIDVDKLIRLWMAQGYVGGSSERDEKKGYECFKILAMHSFFQELDERIDRLGNVSIRSCKMHDIVHDFAQFLVKSECCVFEGEELNSDCQNSETNRKIRHLTMQVGKTKSINSFITPDGLRKVRSLFLSCHGPQVDLWSNLKCVRSLTMSECGLRELPDAIGNLIHIRYLDVSGNRDLKELPEAICNLYFLESLDVSYCDKLEQYPEKIGELVHLKHLLNEYTFNVKQMPRGIEKLVCLRELTEFVASANKNNGGGASFDHLAKLKYLEHWNLRYTEDVDESSMDEILPRLQRLVFVDYSKSQLPRWIVDESLLNNLKCISLRNAHLILSLPALGRLSSLEYLRLASLPKVKEIGSEFYGISYLDDGVHQFVAFPNLKTLVFDSLPNWERWEDFIRDDGFISVMPRLEELRISFCRKLEALPQHILGKASSLKTLSVFKCNKLGEQY